MANSNIVSNMKEKVVMAIAKDDDLFYAIDPSDCENGGDLLNTHIFRYNQNPAAITTVMTFLTVMVHTKSYGRDNDFVIPTLEIWIYDL